MEEMRSSESCPSCLLIRDSLSDGLRISGYLMPLFHLRSDVESIAATRLRVDGANN
jgi:hypothetical protein